ISRAAEDSFPTTKTGVRDVVSDYRSPAPPLVALIPPPFATLARVPPKDPPQMTHCAPAPIAPPHAPQPQAAPHPSHSPPPPHRTRVTPITRRSPRIDRSRLFNRGFPTKIAIYKRIIERSIARRELNRSFGFHARMTGEVAATPTRINFWELRARAEHLVAKN